MSTHINFLPNSPGIPGVYHVVKWKISFNTWKQRNSIRRKIEDAGKAMLKEMSENPETATLESGVVIHPLEPGPDGFGKGVKPTAASTVKVHYHGTLPDGTVFDSSLGKDPVTFPLGGVIAGWREGLQKMCEGETAMLGIPPELGYGEAGTPDGRIPGNNTLGRNIAFCVIQDI